jgi:hypothetical protein
MGFLSTILGGGAASTVEAVGDAVDKIFTSDDERLTREEAITRIKASPYVAALEIAMAEAKSGDKWTSRARPMVLYAFCFVFAVQNGVMPVLWWIVQMWRPETPPPPAVLDLDMVMTVVSGVLGTSFIASRGAEKITKRAV